MHPARHGGRRAGPFQSAPAIAGGRCHRCSVARCGWAGFNPRPPLLAGDAARPGAGVHETDVSIRARHCWRAMRHDWPGVLKTVQVSIRARHCWRAMLGERGASRCSAGVSIRARHCWRAMLPADAVGLMSFLFQSAPAIAGGRCLFSVVTASAACTFQSAPAIAGGRCVCRPEPITSLTSFNPRPPLLAGDAPWYRRSAFPGTGFNPRPPLLAGDAAGDMKAAEALPVSIRARHCWRAMPGEARRMASQAFVSIRARHCWRAMRKGHDFYRHRWSIVSIRARHCWRAMRTTFHCEVDIAEFQSAPAIAGGRCPSTATAITHSTWFQSAPAIAGGRCRCALSRAPAGPSFNPRPPLLAGDASRLQRGDTANVQFQSAPAIAGGRCRPKRNLWQRVLGFNPRPPLLAGDALHYNPNTDDIVVSIRARHCWRAMPNCRWATREQQAQFQSAPAIAGGRCAVTPSNTGAVCGFNPRPPLLAGDAPN